MKNYINITLLSILIILSTVYFFNFRKLIMLQAQEVNELYDAMNNKMDTLDEINEAFSGMQIPVLSATPTPTPGITNGAWDGDKGNITGGAAWQGGAEGSGGTGSSVETANPNAEVLDGYYITLIDNRIAVTMGDRKTVVENTDISAEELGDSDIDKLREGIYAEDIMTVFGILESLSS